MHGIAVAIHKQVKVRLVTRLKIELKMKRIEFAKRPASGGGDLADRHQLLGDGQLGYRRHDYTPEPVATNSTFALCFNPKLSSV